MNLPADDPFAAADRVLRQVPRHVRTACATSMPRPQAERWRWGIILMVGVPWCLGRTHIYRPPTRKFWPAEAHTSATWECAGPMTRFLVGVGSGHQIHDHEHAAELRCSDRRRSAFGALIEVDPATGRSTSIVRIEAQGEM